MKNFISSLFEAVKQKKVFFILLIILSLLTIVLAVFAAINFSGGVISIDLGNIAYVRFLKNQTSLVSFIFSMLFSLLIFFFLIMLFSCKPYLHPLAVIFYLYLVYSQTVVFVSIIMIYGFLNCLVLIMFLLLYLLALISLFTLIMVEFYYLLGVGDYFSSCFNINKSKVITYLIFTICLTLIFCLIVSVLKSFVILLVY